jgi:hypothetical protein
MNRVGVSILKFIGISASKSRISRNIDAKIGSPLHGGDSNVVV